MQPPPRAPATQEEIEAEARRAQARLVAAACAKHKEWFDALERSRTDGNVNAASYGEAYRQAYLAAYGAYPTNSAPPRGCA